MTIPPISIHEFSTGIQIDGDRSDWVSRGFTGDYMNKTLDPIPTAIHSAISNREFAVSEGSSREDPAMIGREIDGTTEKWSVVAIITRGKDDRGRSVSLYRYFFCEGLGHLTDILCWLRTQGGVLTFDPFDSQIIAQPHQYDVTQTTQVPIKSELQDLLNEETPIIVPYHQPCVALIVDAMASQKNIDNQPIAWAYKVEALEKPNRFQVIQPAGEKAEEVLRKAKASTPKLSNVVAEEGQIKTAIKGLISREKPKLEQLQIFESALSNSKIDDNYWKVIFEAQGSRDALNQGIYSAPMVRLLTLQAIARPSILPQFLKWMQKRDKQTDHYEIAEQFQGEIFNNLQGKAPHIANRITEGVRLLIPSLIEYPKIVDSAAWLLGLKRGLWGNVYQKETKKQLEDDFLLKKSYQNQSFALLARNNHLNLLDDSAWQPLINDLDLAWNHRNFQPNKLYLPIAQLFEKLRSYRLAIFFYYISQEIVAKKLFIAAKVRGTSLEVYGIPISREVTSWETLWYFIYQIGVFDMRLYFVVPLMAMAMCVGLGFGGGWWVKKDTSSPQSSSSSQNNNEKTSFDIKRLENEDFPQTQQMLEKLNKYLSKKYNSTNIKDKIVESLFISKPKHLKFDTINKNKKEWVAAIINYQVNVVKPKLENEKINGKILDENDPTYKYLMYDVISNKLNKKDDKCK